MIPFQKIVFVHLTDPKFTTTAIFTEEGDKTRIDLQMLFKTDKGLTKAIEIDIADEGLEQNLK